MGLDKPMPEQLVLYLYIGRGNLGRSMMTPGRTVVKDLRERLPASLELTFSALLIALSRPCRSASRRRCGRDRCRSRRAASFCALGVCVPTFVSGLLLIYIFYYLFGVSRRSDRARRHLHRHCRPQHTGFLLIDFALAGDFEGWWAAFKQLILPACTMALFVIAPLARITRASMLASLGSDFVRTARSSACRWRIIVTYALRNAILPVITIAGIVFSTMLGANVLVEKVFSWPGVASYALDALLVVGLCAGAGLRAADGFGLRDRQSRRRCLYGIADPRISIG
jgi:peptide/nickel transport system permease protein